MRPMLFLVVDAVPYDVAMACWDAGRMPGFEAPRPMVSVFPSLTTVAVPALVRAIRDVAPPSYEARWYDPEAGEVRGGVTAPEVDEAMAPYRTAPGGTMEHIVEYALGSRFTWGEVRWITARFHREGSPWLGYLSSTDAVAHFQGRAALVQAFGDVCDQVVRACDSYATREGRRPGVVLTSDHGVWFGGLQPQRLARLEHLLALAGLTSEARLAPLGDVGAGAVWCDTDDSRAVAEVVAAVPGVELAFARTAPGFTALRVRDGLEEARVRWRGRRYRYEAIRGDPLDLLPILGEAWLDEAALLALTWDHCFPDPLVRVRHGLTELVRQPAQVLFSMADGWTHGPPLIQAAASLRGGQVGTHGALTRAQSLGFAATTEPLWRQPGPLRPSDVFAPWVRLLRRR